MRIIKNNKQSTRLELTVLNLKRGESDERNQTYEAGVQTVVCKGCDAAIEFIESITKS